MLLFIMEQRYRPRTKIHGNNKLITFLTFSFFLSFLVVIPQVRDLDLAFAISANAALDSDENFQKMKDIIDWVITKYGVGKIQFGVVVFGNTPTVKVSFTQPLNDEQLKNIIQNTTINREGSNLESALHEVRILFELSPRPDAKRVLVLVTDKQSDSNLEDVKDSAEDLWRSRIKVIPVAFGRKADPDEIEETTSEKDNLIDVPNTDNPDAVAEEIMEKVLEGQ